MSHSDHGRVGQDSLIAAVRESIWALIKQNKINSLIYSLIIPVIIGVYATYYGNLISIHPLLFWLPVVFFSAFALYAAYITFDSKLAIEYYLVMESMERENSNLRANVEFLTHLQEQCLGWSGLIRAHLAVTDKSSASLIEISSEICRTLVEARESLFGFEVGELWNITLYFYCSESDSLHPVWRDKHPRHPSQGAARVWAPGSGHVGIAFAQAESKICGDAFAPGVWEVFGKGNEKHYDRTAYRSFASQPIGPVGDTKRAYGVLVATSNREGRLNVGSALALRHAAHSLATLINLRYDEGVLTEACRRIDG